ncbi:cysteine desulfurase IscS [Xylanibacillus composti]|uniref:cysteine desulfurase n=1 Tax=Xylanibacillus composti TaxID=1572762 RepID=A0A8J4H6L6_9BACL|nr:cysteine desulfurase family protein [Xylanibacillus composti]GIQ69653.1 cysteine desulfurase IscS [Xylanibacillus composti]
MPYYYFDYNATSPISKRVVAAMQRGFEEFGNPSSMHEAGKRAKRLIKQAREQTAAMLGCKPDNLVLTSGGTEANNLAIQGRLQACLNNPGHLVTSAVEHPSVLEVCRHLSLVHGFETTFLSVNKQGHLSPRELEEAIQPNTQLISVMLANNEVGTIQPIRRIAEIARRQRIFFHCDAVQAAGKLPLDVEELGVDALSISAHKFGGPKGIGALYVRDPSSILPILHGGGQEGGLRSGTENVLAIAGLGEACAEAALDVREAAQSGGRLKRKLLTALAERLEDFTVNGVTETGMDDADSASLWNTVNLRIDGVDGQELAEVLSIDHGVAVSVGSACSSGKHQHHSHVLSAMGLAKQEIESSIRISFGKTTTDEAITYLVQAITEAVHSLRSYAI